MSRDVLAEIDQTVKSQDIVLFMKGTKEWPQCGFSDRVVRILQEQETDFTDINVLEDPAIRQGIKDYTNWPTIPQLFVRGEFVGGCDIVTNLHLGGQLSGLLSPSTDG
ncbi:MAG: Grx4 family monothiol glutaredoxin [Myxococcota bacterium]|nr:Grx4 family monothiol glutaredoxin [Myxococcota bacterium]